MKTIRQQFMNMFFVIALFSQFSLLAKTPEVRKERKDEAQFAKFKLHQADTVIDPANKKALHELNENWYATAKNLEGLFGKYMALAEVTMREYDSAKARKDAGEMERREKEWTNIMGEAKGILTDLRTRYNEHLKALDEMMKNVKFSGSQR